MTTTTPPRKSTATPNPGAPAPDESARAALPSWAMRLTWLLDGAFRIPGTQARIGLDGILGALLPGAGDALTSVGSVSLVLLALKRRVKTVILLRMLLNIAIDATLGAVPVLGDLFDIAYKANHKNLALLQGYSGEGHQSTRPVDYLIVAAVLFTVALSVLLPVLLWSLAVRAFE